jgi:hypothetical protein
MAQLNWGEIVAEAGEATGFDPLPAGDYDLMVLEATTKLTQKDSKTMFSIKTQVQNGPFKGRLIWDNLVVSPENATALGFFFAKMAALGLSREFFTQNSPTNEQIERAITGRQFRAAVKQRAYNGSTTNNIDRYYVPQAGAPIAPVGGATPPPPPPPAAAVAAAPPAPAPVATVAPAPVAEVPVAPAVPAAPVGDPF